MKISSAKMIWQTVAITGIATVAAAAFFASCKKAGNHTSSLHTVAGKKVNTSIGIHSQAGQQKTGSFFFNHTACCTTTLPVENVQSLQRQAGVIYIIF